MSTIDSKAIREWARANGIHVGQRGSLPTPIIDRYRAAMAAEQQPDDAA